jgi:exodeoxyribonuclease V alpha subunit
VVLGGPGSGKTFTVLRLLAVLAASGRVAPERMRLATATGKAAQRLGQAIADGRAALLDQLGAARGRASATDEALRRVLPSLPVEARTLHSVLGARPLSTRVRQDADNPIDCELLVVDEASMVDLPLFARMLAALPAGARLVLLGDPDQLASVEVGSVLAELALPAAGVPVAHAHASVHSGSPQLSLFGAEFTTERTPASSPLGASVMRLRGNHRTAADSGLPRVLDAVREGDASWLRDALADGRGVEWLSQPAQRHDALARALAWYQPVVRTRDPAVALAAFEQARVLVALRSGPDGVDGWNEALLRGLGLADARGPAAVGVAPWRGTPLLISRNDANTGLSNGDVVLAWGPRAQKPADHALARAPDGSLRRIALDLLPPFEPALAMTVHKAQGSEYRRVLVAPPFQPHPLVTRQWLYTACSRARETLVLHAGEDALAAGLAASSRRVSGLADALRLGVPVGGGVAR